MRRWSPLVAIALIGYSGAAVAQSKLVVTAPRSAAGDGTTAIEVTVRVEPASAVAELRNLELQASAGTVGEAKPAGEAGVTYSFVPPRVAADMRVQLIAVAKRGNNKLRGTSWLTASAPTMRAETRATGGAFDLRVPERVRLGRDTSVEISIARPKGEAPDVLVSVGKLSAFEPAGERLRATYTPPASGAPQLAIVAVVSGDRKSLDWARVPLVGQGRLSLRSEAFASVVVQVGGIDFGPVRTNAKGRAELVVEAPPGVDAAVTLATDELGNVRRGTLALGPPPFARLLAICPSLGGRTLYLVVDDDTSPAENPGVRVSASVGTLTEPISEAPGVVATDYSIGADAAFGDLLRITGELDGGAGDGACETTIPGEAPEGIAVRFDRASFTAGSGVPVRVNAVLAYPGKLPPIDVPVQVAADLGAIAMDAAEQGRATGVWTLPDELGGRTSADVTVRAGQLTARASLALKPGPPAPPRIAMSRADVLADGRTRVDLRVDLEDAFGNPVRNAAMSARALGSVTTLRPDGNGSYAAIYVPPRSSEALTDTILISGAGVEGSVAIFLAPSRPRFSVSATGGYLTNFGKVSAPALFGDVAYRPPILQERLSIGIEVGFYASNDERAAAGMGEQVETNVKAVPVLARATYAYPVPIGDAAVYGGVSVGALFSEREVSSPGAGRVVHSGPRLAASGVVGGELRLGPGRVVLEVAYLYAAIDDERLDGNAGGLRIGAGYRYDL